MKYLAALLIASPAFAYTSIESDPPVWTLYYNNAIIKPRVAYKSPMECAVAAMPLVEKNQDNANYTCKATMAVRGTYSTKPIPFVPKPAPVPVPFNLVPR